MAQHQYDALIGDDIDTIIANQTSGASIGSSAVRVTIDDTNCTTKEQAMLALEKIRFAVEKGVWPPVP